MQWIITFKQNPYILNKLYNLNYSIRSIALVERASIKKKMQYFKIVFELITF
jgi:hypothetical protein